MPSSDRPQRPALVPCLAWLAGAGLAARTGLAPPPAILSGALCAVIGLGVGLVPRLRSAGAVLVLAGTALSLASLERDSHRARIDRFFGKSRDVIETEVEAELLRAPERAFDGTRLLELDAGAGSRIRVRVASTSSTPRLDDLLGGDRVRVWGRFTRPHEADDLTRAAAQGVVARGWTKSAHLVERRRGSVGRTSTIETLRRWSRSRLDLALGPTGPVRALTAATLLGDRELLDPATMHELRDSGLVHVVAISGLQVSLVALALTGLAHRCRLPRGLVFPLSMLSLWGFARLVGGAPSVLRAIGAAAALEAGRACGRDGEGLNSLALVAALLVAMAPCSIADPGFQLSVAATGGILLGTRPLASGIPLPRMVALPCGVTLGAYLSTAPLVAYWFGRVTPAAVPTNLVAGPLAAASLALGYPALGLAGVPYAGETALRWASLPSDLLLSVAARAASIPCASTVVAPPGLAPIAIHYLLLAVLWGKASPRPRRGPWLGAALALVGLWIHLGPPPPTETTGRAAVLDVGQGQAVAVHGTGGSWALIDAAGSADPRFDPGERIVVPWLVSNTTRRVATLAVSHEHVDHASGAFAVVRDLEVGELWLPVGWEKSPRLAELAALARERGAGIGLAERGRRIERAGLTIDFLGPARTDRAQSANDRSIVVRARVDGCAILVPGDLDPAGERSLTASGRALDAEVLVVPHHGSRNGSSRALLDRVRPRLAIVSCGKRNRFGHPHPETLARLAGAGASVARTDRSGTLSLRCGRDGFRLVREPGFESEGERSTPPR